MCLHLCCLNFPSTSSWTKSWSQSLLHIIVASFNSSLSHCCLILTNFSFNFQNRTCTETLLHCEVHECFYPTSSHSPKIDSEQESYVHFISALQSIPTNFRTRNVQCSCHISLYGSSNSLILYALEREFHGASEYQLFHPCTCNTRFIKGRKPSNHIRARIKSHVYTTE